LSKNGIAVVIRPVYDEFSGISVSDCAQHKHHNNKNTKNHRKVKGTD